MQPESDYSFMCTGGRGSGGVDTKLLANIQAATMVFLDDAMAFGHFLHCCWLMNGGDEAKSDMYSKKHAIIALKVKATTGMAIEGQTKERVSRYVTTVERYGGPDDVLNHIGDIVQETCDEMMPRYDHIERQVEKLTESQRSNVMVQAISTAEKYDVWEPQTPIAGAIKSTITVLTRAMESDAK